MKRSNAVLIFFFAILLVTALASCADSYDTWRGHTSDGTTVLVEISKGYAQGNEVLVYRGDFVDVRPLTNTKVVLDSIVTQ